LMVRPEPPRPLSEHQALPQIDPNSKQPRASPLTRLLFGGKFLLTKTPEIGSR
jgi:hypothetical protein